MLRRLFHSIFILCALSTSIPAADWYVATNGTGNGSSWAAATNNLQGAITACQSNYTVWVSNGLYKPANLSIGAYVTVRSKSGLPADVILDGNSNGARVVVMAGSSWLIGCTVTNGYLGGSSYGCGVQGGSVSNSIITGNRSNWGAAGGLSVTFYNSVISRNIAKYYAIAASCTFYGCTIFGNTATEGGRSSYATYINSICWSNSGSDFSRSDSFSCGPDYTGTGSITNDPLFISSTDFHLQSISPCINAGTNGAWTIGATDLDGNPRIWPVGGTVDMGAYECFIPPPPIFVIGGTGLDNIGGTGLGNIKGHIQ